MTRTRSEDDEGDFVVTKQVQLLPFGDVVLSIRVFESSDRSLPLTAAFRLMGGPSQPSEHGEDP